MSESFTDLTFPCAGMDLQGPYAAQKPRQLPDGRWARTTRLGRNVRGFEPRQDRNRGGARAGLVRQVATPVVGGWVVQEIGVLAGAGFDPPGGEGMQSSLSGRIVSLIAVSQGNVYTATGDALAWASTTNASNTDPPLNLSGVMPSAQLNQKMWFVDGTHARVYDPVLNTVFDWTASAGTFPADSELNAPRLLCTWRGRLVLSGLLLDGQNVFFAAVGSSGTSTDFDYFPADPSPTQAVALNVGPQGLAGDLVTALIPYTDDVLLIGGDHTIYALRGDPAAGGQLDLVTSSIGMAWGRAWCMDPYGVVYFLSNNVGVYRMTPGQLPERISQPVEQLLAAYDTGRMILRLQWDDPHQCLHVWGTFAEEPAATTHFAWEQRTNAWFIDSFDNTSLNPLCCCTFDGNRPQDRAALIGCWDGYVRTVSGAAGDDDGVPIRSRVLIGPLNSKDLDDIMLKDLQAVLGEDSGPVTWAVYTGRSAEGALAAGPVASGIWGPGRNQDSFVRRAGHAHYLDISASTPWAMEQVRARLGPLGKVRQRGN